MQDYSTYPNLIGLRTGKFTSSSTNPQKTNNVTYVAASHIDQFEYLYKAQHKHFQTTKTLSIDLYGIRLRITPLPTSSSTGTDLCNILHDACSSLFRSFSHYIKVPIPITYFTKPINDQIITSILKTKYVHACIPFFQDETDTDPDHYVLFLANNCDTTYTHANDIYKVLTDFPPGLFKPVSNKPITTPTPTNTMPTDSFTTHIDDDIAFLQLLTNTDIPETPTSVPNQISTATKRPHHPTGTTIQPELRRPRQPKTNTTSTHIPDHMEIDTEQQQHTTTDHSESEPSEGYRFLLNCNPPIRRQHTSSQDYPDEYIPDEEYCFDLAHSQATRLEIRDALGLAKAISPTNYNKTFDYIQRKSKSINIDQLKQYATHPFPPEDAHNDNTASPNEYHE
jgi:hypothetical protein